MTSSKRGTERHDHKHELQDIMLKYSARRRFMDKIVTIFVIVCVISSIVPLASILIEVIKNGASAISIEFLTQPPGSLISGHGGIGPAIQGTLIVVGLASLIGAPIGVTRRDLLIRICW